MKNKNKKDKFYLKINSKIILFKNLKQNKIIFINVQF